MSNIAIQAEHLSKQYRIGKRKYTRDLRETLTNAMSVPFRSWVSVIRRTPRNPTSTELIWALENVSFEVAHGNVVGIVGNNGAGKSTLLKILSRITEPTNGQARIYGRVGSLLEVGTGFHSELTGRENIFLSGAILGMKRTEITRKFDEIVAFAEVEKFIDTPVKYYSSGMYVRLGFAVAAHLEPEILLVDEVLAVGDATFQRKCLGKMSDVAHEGRTVLFVSHNMGAIVQLCQHAIWLDEGGVREMGESGIVVRDYLLDTDHQSSDVHLDPLSIPDSPLVLTRCWINNESGMPCSTIDVTQGWIIGLQVQARRAVADIDIGVLVLNSQDQSLFTTSLSDSSNSLASLTEGKHTFFVKVPGNLLAPDTYVLSVGIHRPNVQIFDLRERLVTFQVAESGSRMWQYLGKKYGNILVHFPWQHTYMPGET